MNRPLVTRRCGQTTIGVQRRPAVQALFVRSSLDKSEVNEASTSTRGEWRLVDQRTAIAFVAVLSCLAVDQTPAIASAQHMFDTAEGGQEFWGNVLRYGRYFVTVMLGTGYVMLRPIAGMFQKSPLSALLAVGLVLGAVLGTKVTLDAMLGLSSGVTMASDGFM